MERGLDCRRRAANTAGASLVDHTGTPPLLTIVLMGKGMRILASGLGLVLRSARGNSVGGSSLAADYSSMVEQTQWWCAVGELDWWPLNTHLVELI